MYNTRIEISHFFPQKSTHIYHHSRGPLKGESKTPPLCSMAKIHIGSIKRLPICAFSYNPCKREEWNKCIDTGVYFPCEALFTCVHFTYSLLHISLYSSRGCIFPQDRPKWQSTKSFDMAMSDLRVSYRHWQWIDYYLLCITRLSISSTFIIRTHDFNTKLIVTLIEHIAVTQQHLVKFKVLFWTVCFGPLNRRMKLEWKLYILNNISEFYGLFPSTHAITGQVTHTLCIVTATNISFPSWYAA